jgi:hypothetical protein
VFEGAGLIATLMGALVVAACAKTSQVSDDATPAKPAATKHAVAVIRIGSASPQTGNVAVLLGTCAVDGYRRGQAMTGVNERPVSEAPVAEIELAAGKHHAIGYSCHTQKGTKMVMDPARGTLFRKSHAQFHLEPGEVVNVGYFHFGASHAGRSAFGRPIRTDVEVGDWPLNELERFKLKPPTVYAQLKTRLTIVSDKPLMADALADRCANGRRLPADSKAQTVPNECVPPAGAATR